MLHDAQATRYRRQRNKRALFSLAVVNFDLNEEEWYTVIYDVE
jgi:hypothetical protein